MSFTDGKQRIATEEDCKAPWLGEKKGINFRCCFCGHKFKVGDKWRWVHTGHIIGAYGNPLICEKCDLIKSPTPEERWKGMHAEWKEMQLRWWWFMRR